MRGEPAIQSAQEGPALSVVVLPRVLAVQNDEYGPLSPARAGVVSTARRNQAVNEIVRGAVG